MRDRKILPCREDCAPTNSFIPFNNVVHHTLSYFIRFTIVFIFYSEYLSPQIKLGQLLLTDPN